MLVLPCLYDFELSNQGNAIMQLKITLYAMHVTSADHAKAMAYLTPMTSFACKPNF